MMIFLYTFLSIYEAWKWSKQFKQFKLILFPRYDNHLLYENIRSDGRSSFITDIYVCTEIIHHFMTFHHWYSCLHWNYTPSIQVKFKPTEILYNEEDGCKLFHTLTLNMHSVYDKKRNPQHYWWMGMIWIIDSSTTRINK